MRALYWVVALMVAVISHAETPVKITVHNERDRQTARQLGDVLEDYGSFVVVAAREPQSKGALDLTINLRTFRYDPLRENPAGREHAALPDGDYYLVQFIAPARDEWLEAIRASGGEVVQYVPHQAFLVHATSDAMARIARLPRVRWTGVLQPGHKLARGLEAAPGGAFDVAVFKRGNRAGVKAEVLRQHGRVLHEIVLPANNYFDVLRVELPAGALRAIARQRDVIGIDAYVRPEKEDERAAHIVAGNYTSQTSIAGPGYNSLAQFGVDGTNVTVSVVDDGVGIPGDGGFYITANNATNGPLRGASAGAQGHGHLNATIIAGSSPFSVLDPTSHNYALGIARRSCIVNIPYLRSGYSGTEANTVDDTVNTPGPNGVKGTVSNNSWGSGTNGNTYDSFAAQYDGFVQDASVAGTIDPLCIIFSAGNSGLSGLTRPKVAKNVIAVANSENLRTEVLASADNIDQLESSSSRGPAADGRVKPDLTAPGTAIAGGRSGPDVLFGNIDAAHRWSLGTSHAAPQVAGTAALFTQFWKLGHGGTNPSPALIKAALINGAVEMNSDGTTTPIPNGNEGWGRINLKNMLNTGVPILYVDQTLPLQSPGQTYTLTGWVGTGDRHLRISLVWTDPPGVSDPALVNDLDLEVTVDGVTYKGNAFSNGVSIAGGAADTLNNVENVFLPAGIAAGTPVSILVRASALNGNGILGNSDATDQHFAIVGFNVQAPVILAGGSTLTAENCVVANGAIDPGETVTIDFGLRNIGSSNTANLVATMLPTGGVMAPSGAQSYSVLVTNGAVVSRPFTFTATGSCGSNITASLELHDGTTHLGTVSQRFTLGATVPLLSSKANTNAIAIPAKSQSGVAAPYPSTNIVSGVVGSIAKVTVTLTNLSHANPDDIDVLLIGPGGQTVLLMSDTGGGAAVNNVTLTFDDDAAALLPDATQIISGTYRPTNFDATGADTFPSPAPAGPYGSALSVFNGLNPNGLWLLYVNDDANPSSGSLASGWRLNITTTTNSCCTDIVNQPPVVTNAFVTAVATNTTEDLTVLAFASDPENFPVTFAYQWQETATNLAGQTASTLPAGVTFAGGTYRCVVTPSDGQTNGAAFPTAAVLVPVDSDGDGLNDDWEVAYFGNLSRTGDEDADGDGFDNAQEFVAGTNPSDAGSAPLITSVAADDADIVISFVSVAGKSYDVLRSGDVVGGWTALTNVTATGGSTQVIDPGGALESLRFYRVQVLP